MIKTYPGSDREKTIWQYLGSVLSRSLFLWILFAQGVAWTEAAQTVEKTVSKNSNLGAVFSAEGYLDPLWALVVTPVIHWQHASCVVQTEFGWVVDTAGGGCAESAIFKCATMVYPYELQFQGRVFTGKLEPCEIHELPPPNGSGGSENTGWKITARTMGYQVLPEQATICVNQTTNFYTTDLQGNLLTDPSNWTLTPQVGGAPTGPYPPGTSVFVPSITPGVPGVYKVKGTSTETGESDTATLTIIRVEFRSLELTDEGPVTYPQLRFGGKLMGTILCGAISPKVDLGIAFRGTATIPECCEGELQFVQNIMGARTVTFKDGSKLQLNTGGKWYLDADPYPLNGDHHLVSEDIYEITSEDSPGQGLYNLDGWIDNVVIEEGFAMFLLFNPASSLRYTLGKATWNWRAKVLNNKPDWPFGGELIIDDIFSEVPDAPNGSESTDFPVTSPNWKTDLEFTRINGNTTSMAEIMKGHFSGW